MAITSLCFFKAPAFFRIIKNCTNFSFAVKFDSIWTEKKSSCQKNNIYCRTLDGWMDFGKLKEQIADAICSEHVGLKRPIVLLFMLF